ncbi:substrate-binding domain-containing protein [Haloferula helveola]
MPGVHRLSAEFQINRKTVEAALRVLEEEGLLIGQGPGRRRTINPAAAADAAAMRVAILLFEPSDTGMRSIVDIRHQLEESGHTVTFAPKTLTEMKMDPSRVSRVVESHDADAWIVVAGSPPVLQWFVEQPRPAFALFGRHTDINIATASANRRDAIVDAVRELARLGHRRVVLLGRSLFRFPNPAQDAQTFLSELEAHGIPTGAYNLPDWDDTADGFIQSLDRLFAATPPTALLIDEPFLFHAAQTHLAQHGILAPKHVSLVCLESDFSFSWCRPTVAHVRMNVDPIVRHAVRWANRVVRGKDDPRKLLTKASFVTGGTVGAAPS